MKTKHFLVVIIILLFFSFCYSQDYWESIYSSSSSIHCIAINSIGYLFVGTQNGIYRSIDNGAIWDSILAVGAAGSIEINPQDDIYSSPAPLYFSLDNGDNWDTLNYPGFSAIHIFIDSENNIFVGFWGGIYKSNNNGVSWELVFSCSTSEVIYSIVENSEGILFAGAIHFMGLEGGVYKSTNQGDNWEQIGLEYEYISSLAINSSDEIFAGSRGSHYGGECGVFRSSDNGETWTNLRDDVLVTSVAINSEDMIFIGCSNLDCFTGAVHFSSDNGESWVLIESEEMPSTIGIEFITISSDNYIYAISYETISHVYRSVQPTYGITSSPIQETNNKLCNYPNPFATSTEIKFSLSDEIRYCSAKIYNTKGQFVKVLETTIEGNSASANWDGTDLKDHTVSNGIYFYTVQTEYGQKTNKMLKTQ